jgi:uracil-DNA glycosylase
MIKIEKTWHEQLQPEFEKEYFRSLVHFVKEEYAAHACYPNGGDIFSAFKLCPFPEVKVVILGQDPYHGVGQAHGLCFSVNDGVPFPPSLQNIFKERETDVGLPVPQSGNLEHWAKQGVLLLNAILTVRANQAASHQGRGWETFTDAVIRAIAEKNKGVVFMLWGSYAQKKGAIVNAKEHCILQAPHPSPLSVYRGFYGCKHFSRANQYLQTIGKTPVNW